MVVFSIRLRISSAVAIGKVLLQLIDARTFVRNHDERPRRAPEKRWQTQANDLRARICGTRGPSAKAARECSPAAMRRRGEGGGPAAWRAGRAVRK